MTVVLKRCLFYLHLYRKGRPQAAHFTEIVHISNYFLLLFHMCLGIG